MIDNIAAYPNTIAETKILYDLWKIWQEIYLKSVRSTNIPVADSEAGKRGPKDMKSVGPP